MNQALPDNLSLLLSLIRPHDEAEPPIWAVYGGSPHFERLVADFCVAAQQAEDALVVSFDIGNVACQTPEDGLFSMIQQLFDALLKRSEHTEDRSQLLTAFYDVWNLSNAVKGLSQEERFAAFVRFTEYVAYPLLTALLRKSPRRIVCVARNMEKADCWATMMHHFVLETLLQALNGIDLQCILFINSARPPDLFYGSNEDDAANRVRLLRVEMEYHAESVCGEI